MAALDVNAPHAEYSAPLSMVLVCAGFSSASAAAGDALHFHAALRLRPALPLFILSAAAVLDIGDSRVLLELGPASSSADESWHLYSASLPAPSAVCARALLLRASSHCDFRVPLGEPQGTQADAVLYTPADELAPAAAHVARLGGLPGVLLVSAAPPQQPARLTVSPPLQPLLSGQLAPLGITLASAAEALHSPVLRLSFAGAVAPVVLAELPDGSRAELCACADQGTMEWQCGDDVAPLAVANFRLLLCFADETASSLLTVSLVCGEAALQEAQVSLPAVRSPLSLSFAYMGALQQHSLMPPARGQVIQLPAGMPAVLAATLQGGGSLTLLGLELEGSEGWSVEVRAALRCAARLSRVLQTMHTMDEPAELEEGDAFTHLFSLTPPAAPSAASSPGCLVATWEASNVRGLGLSPATTRLSLAPVALEVPLIHVTTSWPTDVVVGVQTTVSICVQNRGALEQELAVVVGDSAGFVFAGDRSAILLLLPHSNAVVEHTFVAHAAGWQPMPEVTLTLARNSGARPRALAAPGRSLDACSSFVHLANLPPRLRAAGEGCGV